MEHLIIEYYIYCEARYKMSSRLASDIYDNYRISSRYREKNIIFLYFYTKAIFYFFFLSIDAREA